RRQPQTTASATGRPVAGSHATTVSPSLSRPIAVTTAGPPTASTTSATVSCTERTTSSASLAIQPGCGWVTATRRDASATGSRRSSNATVRVPVVPWSTPIRIIGPSSLGEALADAVDGQLRHRLDVAGADTHLAPPRAELAVDDELAAVAPDAR